MSNENAEASTWNRHDTDTFQAWLRLVLPPTSVEGVVAYNFNIAETSDAFVIEVVGSSHYDPTDADWACEEVWTSRPYEFRAPYSDVGRQWEPFLGQVCASVRDFLGKRPSGSAALLEAQAVTVGFVDGELVRVGGVSDAPPEH